MHEESPKIILESASMVRLVVPKDRNKILSHFQALQDTLLLLDEEVANYTQKLAVGKRAVLWPKDSGEKLTDMDRKIRNDADVAPIERDLIFMKSIQALLQDRIKLVLILLHN